MSRAIASCSAVERAEDRLAPRGQRTLRRRFGAVDLRLGPPAVEDQLADRAEQAAGDDVEYAVESDGRGADRAAQPDKRQELGARALDPCGAGQQRGLGGAHVGPAPQHFGRRLESGEHRRFRHEVGALEQPQHPPRRLADQRRDRVGGRCQVAFELRDLCRGLCAVAARLLDIEARNEPCLYAPARDLQVLVLIGEGVAANDDL